MTEANSSNSPPRLFGRKCQTWYRDEVVETLRYFQVDHSARNTKGALLDLLYRRVVLDRGVDESAVPAKELLRLIRREDGVAFQPLIGTCPTALGSDDSIVATSRPGSEAQSSSEEQRKTTGDLRTVNLTDYWPKNPAQNCSVCDTDLLRTVNTPWRRLSPECGHRSTICLSCLQQHIENQLAMNSWNKISCPICPSTLSPADIQAWSTSAFFDRYGRISVQQAVLDGLPLRWCAIPECQNGFLCDPEIESYVTCDACGRMSCLECNVEYHAGISCKDFQDRRERRVKRKRIEQEERSISEIQRICVECPGKGCSAPIQKRSGCDQMKCNGL